MPCTWDAPCGGVRRTIADWDQVLAMGATHEVYECLNGHTFIRGPVPELHEHPGRGRSLMVPRLEGRFAALRTQWERRCTSCGTTFLATHHRRQHCAICRPWLSSPTTPRSALRKPRK